MIYFKCSTDEIMRTCTDTENPDKNLTDRKLLGLKLVNAANNNPLNCVQVHIKRPDGSYGIGWTDSTGNLCGKVPKDEPLVLEVIDQCNAIAWSQNIGPFSANATLGTVAVSLPESRSATADFLLCFARFACSSRAEAISSDRALTSRSRNCAHFQSLFVIEAWVAEGRVGVFEVVIT